MPTRAPHWLKRLTSIAGFPAVLEAAASPLIPSDTPPPQLSQEHPLGGHRPPLCCAPADPVLSTNSSPETYKCAPGFSPPIQQNRHSCLGETSGLQA